MALDARDRVTVASVRYSSRESSSRKDFPPRQLCAQPTSHSVSHSSKVPSSKDRTSENYELDRIQRRQRGVDGSAQRSIRLIAGMRQCRTEPRMTLPLCAAARELFRSIS